MPRLLHARRRAVGIECFPVESFDRGGCGVILGELEASTATPGRRFVAQLPGLWLTVRASLQETGFQNVAPDNETSVRSLALGHARRNPKDWV